MANPAPHGPVRRTLSCYALIPLVLVAGALALAGALILQGTAKVGRSLQPLEVPLQWVGLTVMLVFGALHQGGAVAILGLMLAAAAMLGPTTFGGRLLGFRFKPDRQARFPILAIFLGAIVFAAPLFLIAIALMAPEVDLPWWEAVLMVLPMMLALSLMLVRLEDHKPSFRPISVKHTK